MYLYMNNTYLKAQTARALNRSALASFEMGERIAHLFVLFP